MRLFGLGKPKDVDAAPPAMSAWMRTVVDAVLSLDESGTLDGASLRRNSSDAMPDGAGDRRDWIVARTIEAMSHPAADAAFRMDEDLGRAIRTELASPGSVKALMSRGGLNAGVERVAFVIGARRVQLAETGVHAMRRIAAERDVLVAAADAVLVRRFAHSPHARMDGPPSDAPRRREWVQEMLLGEAAAISSGAMPPQDVAMAARVSRTPIGEFAKDGAMTVSFPAFLPDAYASMTETRRSRAERLAMLDPALVAERFSVIPGFTDHASADRVALMLSASIAEDTRRIAMLPGASSTPSDVLTIDMSDLSAAADGELVFSGDLIVSGERICRISSGPDGAIEADMWSEGCGHADLASIDLYLAAFGGLRDDGTALDSLSFRILDIVGMKVAVDAYSEAAAQTVFFRVDERGEAVLVAVRIPQGGDREGAIAYVAGENPSALPLDRLPLEDAALTWMALT